jgi:hypothetical protein
LTEQTIAPAGFRLQHSSNPLLGPTEFRNFYYAWKLTAPANDSDIIPDKPKVADNPRHAGLCADLKSMLAWKARYESTDPLQTNYLQHGEFDVILNDDGSKESVKQDSEGNLKEQSAEEIMAAYEDVVFKKRYDNVICYTDYCTFTYKRERLIPDLDAPKNKEPIAYWHKGKRLEHTRIDFGEEYESPVFGLMKSVTHLGTVTFSDTDLDPRHRLGSVMRFGPGRFGKPVVRRTPKKLSGRFLPPPEVQRFNPLERLIAMEDAIAANDTPVAERDAFHLVPIARAGLERQVLLVILRAKIARGTLKRGSLGLFVAHWVENLHRAAGKDHRTATAPGHSGCHSARGICFRGVMT